MARFVDFKTVSTSGLESSPIAEGLAGLRANEARYYRNKFDHDFVTAPAADDPEALAYVERVLREESGIEFAAKPLEVSRFRIGEVEHAYVFYRDGLVVNVMYDTGDPKKRAVGLKLSQGMDVPAELEGKFKFARQKSKLAGEIRGSFFVIKGAY